MQNKKNGGLFLLIGLVLILAAVGSYLYRQNYQKTAVETTAVVTEIREDRSGEDVTYRVYIRFETQAGETVNTQLDYGSSSIDVGDQLTVYYRPEQPDKVISKSGGLLISLALGGMGLVFAVLGGNSLIKKKQTA